MRSGGAGGEAGAGTGAIAFGARTSAERPLPTRFRVLESPAGAGASGSANWQKPRYHDQADSPGGR